MNGLLSLLSDICLLVGGLLCLTGGVGLLRLPDFYSRLHASSVTESLAAPILIFGLMLDSGWTLDTAKLILLIIFMLVANPTITHALCRAAAHGRFLPPDHKEMEEEDESSNNSTS